MLENNTYKICLLGDAAVGKTSLIYRYVKDHFSEKYKTTIGCQLLKKKNLEIEVNLIKYIVNLIIWDLEGDNNRISDNPILLDSYLRGATGAIIVGDLERDGTFENFRSYKNKFHERNPLKPIIYALNKTDLISNERQERKTIEIAEVNNLSKDDILPTSAKDNHNVNFLFQKISQKIVLDLLGNGKTKKKYTNEYFLLQANSIKDKDKNDDNKKQEDRILEEHLDVFKKVFKLINMPYNNTDRLEQEARDLFNNAGINEHELILFLELIHRLKQKV